MKLAMKMGPDYIPDYFHDPGDYKVNQFQVKPLG
jgi:hypothetical protein